MHNKNKSEDTRRSADASRFSKRIGSITYEVSVHFKKNANETLEKKIMRLIKNEMGAAS